MMLVLVKQWVVCLKPLNEALKDDSNGDLVLRWCRCVTSSTTPSLHNICLDLLNNHRYHNYRGVLFLLETNPMTMTSSPLHNPFLN